MKNVILTPVLIALFLALNLTAFAQMGLSSERSPQKALSTEFLNIESYSDGNGVWLRWQMSVEDHNLGFNVYRLTGDRKEAANEYLIGGGVLQSADEIVNGRSYSFFDPQGSFESIYVIESVGLYGQRHDSEAVSTKLVNSLTSFAGRTSFEIKKDLDEAGALIEKNGPILPAELEKERSNNLLPPNINMQRLISGQPAVKIGVKKEGIYHVSRSELQSAGFDINGPSANWQLFKNGNEQAMIVGSADDYIEFYGTPIDTIEASKQIYYLINGPQNGKRIVPSFQRGIGPPVISSGYRQSLTRADRVLYLNNIRNGDANNFVTDRVVNSSGTNFVFNLDAIDPTLNKINFEVRIQGFTQNSHNIEVTLNGESLGLMSGSNHQLMNERFEIPVSILIEGANTLRLKVPSGTADVSFLESVKVDYSRKYAARQNALSFYTNFYRKSVLAGFTSPNIRVFDITNTDSVTQISNLTVTQNGADHSVVIPSNRSKVMYAVEDSAILPANSIEFNTPSTLTTPSHNANFIIISYKDWLTEAEVWANYRRNEGYTVEVIRVDDIFDEFNYGNVSSISIRQFLQYARGNWTTPPNYLLILGDTTYDPRNYLGLGDVNFVPTKMIDTVYEETGSDESLADFDDDGLAELAVGRVTARNGLDVTQNLNKVILFEQTSSQGFSRGALFVSDLPNGYDFQGMSQRLATELPVGSPVMFVNRIDPNPRTSLLAALDAGKYLVNYSGHGSTGLWATSDFYNLNDPLAMANVNNLSIFTMLTCLNGYFLTPNFDGLSESMMKAPNGGVVVWSSTGKTTPDVQEILARRFYRQISISNMNRMGDLINDAKQSLTGGRDVRLSWALLGDPTLKVK